MAHPPGQLPPYKKPDKPDSPWEPGKSPAPSKPSLVMQLGINKPAMSSDRETEIQRFSDPMSLKTERRNKLLIAGSPQLGGTGKSLGNIEYQFGLDDAWNNYINSDMTPLDAQIYQNRIRTLNMQSKYGV